MNAHHDRRSWVNIQLTALDQLVNIPVCHLQGQLLGIICFFSKIGGFPPKSSILIQGFHYFHPPFWGYPDPYFWISTHIVTNPGWLIIRDDIEYFIRVDNYRDYNSIFNSIYRSPPKKIAPEISDLQILWSTSCGQLRLANAATLIGPMHVWLVVEPTPFKNMIVKLGSSSLNRGEHKTYFFGNHYVDIRSMYGIYGCFLKWWYPQIIHFNRVFHYKPSILGYLNFRKPSYVPTSIP